MSETNQGRVARGASPAWWIVVALWLALLFLVLLCSRLPSADGPGGASAVHQRVIDPVPWPEFRLNGADHNLTTREQLLGSVWIADFLSRQCTSCAPLSGHIADLQERLVDSKIRFVTFSIDPTDSTASLANHQDKFRRVDRSRWTVLAADTTFLPEILVRVGFAESLDHVRRQLCTLSPRFFLVDRSGKLRGSYNATHPLELEWLVHDASALASSSE